MLEKKSTPLASPAPPCCFVIFGASGDLTHRLLLPALYNLAASRLLPDAFSVIGIARANLSDDAFREALGKGLRQFATRTVDSAIADRLLDCVRYVAGDVDDAQTYRRLGQTLEDVERTCKTNGNRLFYLATPPTAFAAVGRRLAELGLTREEKGAWRRLIIEKPFGTDLASAMELNRQLLSVLSEHQIYRIDHYLGKETVQNILVFRFANGLFEPIWNRNHIDHVQITVAESLLVGHRGRFYDAVGALRDMVPNHLFQLLSLTAMEPPARFDARTVRLEKTEALDAVLIPNEATALSNSVRAQYVAAGAGNDRIAGYLQTPDVALHSTTETYVALKLMIDNWRWAGVPFYLRTGKALKARMTEIAINFKQAPFTMFRKTPVDSLTPNFLIMKIQPDECISLQFNAKVPGPSIGISGVGMTFRYEDYFEATPSVGYETLIYDCMIGDQILFQPAASVEAGWRVVQPFLDAWRNAGSNHLATYEAGSEGPVEADQLLARDGRQWCSIS